MTTLLASGDSWTSCWPLEERLGHRDFGWPNLVSNHFGFDLIDKSRAGSSNSRIYRKAFDGILAGNVDLALVFLTNWSRFETGANYGDKSGRIYQHIVSDKKSDQAFRLFFNGYKIYTDTLRQIVSLQILAAEKKIPCFFLDTFDSNIILDISLDDFKKILQYNTEVFENMDDQRIYDKFKKTKMLSDQIDKKMFISLQSYQTLVQGCELEKGHPTESGHRKIADVVINFLKDNHYGKTL